MAQATNPESSTITYSYDTSGNLYTRKDARSATTTMMYDGVNRVMSKNYSSLGSNVTYTYDTGGAAKFALGRLTPVQNQSGQIYTRGYNNLGQVNRRIHPCSCR